MPRFFVEPFVGEYVQIAGEDARHIAKSLRMQPGEEIILCDGQGSDYTCVLDSVETSAVTARVMEKSPNRSEPRLKIRLYQALPKGDKLELITQKAVELGVWEIVPVLTERCISRPDEKAAEKKIAKLQRTALEAAKQSGRGIVPLVRPLQSFREAVGGMKSHGPAILLYERAETPLRHCIADMDGSASLFVGSEGGFSPEEAGYAIENGVRPASLGRRILRCETAPLCALSAIFFASGEF